jgi:flagella basal body P-ring formation protein FlgA
VTEGAEVIITSKAGLVKVDVVGLAMEDGQFGEWIKVRNASSGQAVFAKVISEKKVAVIAKKS